MKATNAAKPAARLANALRRAGISTTADIDRLKGFQSRYGFLKSKFGEANADLIMRNLEVASWFR